MKYKLAFCLILSFMVSCNEKASKINSPLTSIIKINSSEALGDLDEARKYQDIKEVYGEYAKEVNTTPEKYWKDYVASNSMLASDKKFTNQFKYYNYNIEEVINGERAKVVFTNKNKSDRVKSIIYELKFVDRNWVLQKTRYQTIDSP